MLFKPELIDKILLFEKTETRRIQHEGDHLNNDGGIVYRKNGLVRYHVNQTHCLQPKRGKAALFHKGVRTAFFGDRVVPDPVWSHVFCAAGSATAEHEGWREARIRIKALRGEDARLISEADAIAEGFDDRRDFLKTYALISDPKVKRDYDNCAYAPADSTARFDWDDILKNRPAKFYICWVLTFGLYQ